MTNMIILLPSQLTTFEHTYCKRRQNLRRHYKQTERDESKRDCDCEITDP